MHIDLDNITEINDKTIFQMEEKPKRAFEKDVNVQMDITIEMNRDQVTLGRNVYTSLDVLADIGGIQSILVSGIAIFFSVWNYGHFDNNMTTKLFKIKDEPAKTSTSSSTIRPSKFFNFAECLFDSMIPTKLRCRCCRKSRKMRGIEKAREKLAKEVNIINIVKSRRLFFQALKLLLTRE